MIMINKNKPTSCIQVNRDCFRLRLHPSVVPASVWVLAPCFSVARIQALIIHGRSVHPQSVADGGQTVDADLATVAIDLRDAVVH